MPYNPSDAPEPTPPRFKNVVEMKVNEVIAAQEALSRGRFRDALPDNLAPDAPYWDLVGEALDAKFEDGTKLPIKLSTKLFDKDGKVLDKRQRPFLITSAFAGLGIAVFPGDPEGKFGTRIGPSPNYDLARVVGNKFIMEQKVLGTFADGRENRILLPVTELGPNYVYSGSVRIVTRRSDDEPNLSPNGAIQPVTLADIMSSNEAKVRVLAILNGQPAEADLFDALRNGGVDNQILFDGQSILAVAVAGDLASALTEKGFITIEDNKIVVVA